MSRKTLVHGFRTENGMTNQVAEFVDYNPNHDPDTQEGYANAQQALMVQLKCVVTKWWTGETYSNGVMKKKTQKMYCDKKFCI